MKLPETATSTSTARRARGEAIIGLKVGAKTSYETPNGKQIAVEIHLVETFTG